jgi:dihydrolipoamide dehydrogenase
MDAEMAKQFQKMLTKQGFKFKLSTKVVSGKVENDKVYLEVDAAKGGKAETVRTSLNQR